MSSSPYINRFLQPDSIISSPSNPQSWNRYSYVVSNPLRYTDPTGHKYNDCEGLDDVKCKRKMQHLGKVMARQNAGTVTQQTANLYCGLGCNPFSGAEGTLGGFGNGWASFTASNGSYQPFTYSRNTGKAQQIEYVYPGHWVRWAKNGERAPSWETGPIDPVELDGMMEVVGYDVQAGTIGWYDTPFFNNYGLPYIGLEGTVYFNGKYYDRSEFNYWGEGEAYAAMGYSIDDTHAWVKAWKNLAWGWKNGFGGPSQKVYDMTDVGWYYYNSHFQCDVPTQVEFGDPFDPAFPY